MRNGALYASDSRFASSTSLTRIQDAALADAANLGPVPTITSTSGTDSGGNAYVEVTASYQFQTVSNYPGIPNKVSLSRTIRMALSPL